MAKHRIGRLCMILPASPWFHGRLPASLPSNITAFVCINPVSLPYYLVHCIAIGLSLPTVVPAGTWNTLPVTYLPAIVPCFHGYLSG